MAVVKTMFVGAMAVMERLLKILMLRAVAVISTHLAAIATAKFSATNVIGLHEKKTYKNKAKLHHQVIGIYK